MKTDGNPFDGLRSEDLIQKLEDLKNQNLDAFFELVFQSIVNWPEEAVDDKSPVDNKIKALERIIKHFQDLEEYEKCQELKIILDRIKWKN
jgi:hypothetical protein